jgi:hypothetical protein
MVKQGKSVKFQLRRVKFMPKELEAGVLYVSEEFNIAIHLCACGCGFKVRTPLGPTEWSVKQTPLGPSLIPSIGNWQQPCQSHYWIRHGEVKWAEKWTQEQIATRRLYEEQRRRIHYDASTYAQCGILQRFWHRFKGQ